MANMRGEEAVLRVAAMAERRGGAVNPLWRLESQTKAVTEGTAVLRWCCEENSVNGFCTAKQRRKAVPPFLPTTTTERQRDHPGLSPSFLGGWEG